MFVTNRNITVWQAIGEFLLTERNIKIPNKGNIYSINEGYSHLWDDTVTEYVRRKKDPKVILPGTSFAL